jgi:hypothetical protein
MSSENIESVQQSGSAVVVFANNEATNLQSKLQRMSDASKEIVEKSTADFAKKEAFDKWRAQKGLNSTFAGCFSVLCFLSCFILSIVLFALDKDFRSGDQQGDIIDNDNSSFWNESLQNETTAIIINKDLYLLTRFDFSQLTLLGIFVISSLLFLVVVHVNPSVSPTWKNFVLIFHDFVKFYFFIACCFNMSFLSNDLYFVWLWIAPKLILTLTFALAHLRKAWLPQYPRKFNGYFVFFYVLSSLIVAAVFAVVSEFYFIGGLFFSFVFWGAEVNWIWKKFLLDFLCGAKTTLMIRETIDWKTSFAKDLIEKEALERRMYLVLGLRNENNEEIVDAEQLVSSAAKLAKETEALRDTTPQELFARFHKDFVDSDENVVVPQMNKDGFYRRWRHTLLFSRFADQSGLRITRVRRWNLTEEFSFDLVRFMKIFLKRGDKLVKCGDINQLSILDFFRASDFLGFVFRDLAENDNVTKVEREYRTLFFVITVPVLLNSVVSLIFCFFFPIIYFNTISAPILMFWIA